MSCFPAAMHFILWPMHTRMYKQVQLETFMLIQIMSGSLNLSLKKLTDIPCNVCLLAPNSLSFCLSCNVLICLYFFIDKWVKKKFRPTKYLYHWCPDLPEFPVERRDWQWWHFCLPPETFIKILVLPMGYTELTVTMLLPIPSCTHKIFPCFWGNSFQSISFNSE